LRRRAGEEVKKKAPGELPRALLTIYSNSIS